MIKGFIATVSVAVFMLVCVATNVSAGYESHGRDRGSPYGDYQKEVCERECRRSPPYCHSNSFARKIGRCWTCCRIEQKWYPHDHEEHKDMEHKEMDHDEMEMNQEKSENINQA